MTLSNAIEWAGTDDKFVFCLELLDASARDEDCDERVAALEAEFKLIIRDVL